MLAANRRRGVTNAGPRVPSGATAVLATAERRPAREKQRPPDEHLGLRFWVQIDGIEVAGFRSVSPLYHRDRTFEYAEGGLNTLHTKLPVRTKYANITLRRGIDPGADLFSWFMVPWTATPKRKNRQHQHLFTGGGDHG